MKSLISVHYLHQLASNPGEYRDIPLRQQVIAVAGRFHSLHQCGEREREREQ
jgi:hypothetical protein